MIGREGSIARVTLTTVFCSGPDSSPVSLKGHQPMMAGWLRSRRTISVHSSITGRFMAGLR